jgi:hypothetical protein
LVVIFVAIPPYGGSSLKRWVNCSTIILCPWFPFMVAFLLDKIPLAIYNADSTAVYI